MLKIWSGDKTISVLTLQGVERALKERLGCPLRQYTHIPRPRTPLPLHPLTFGTQYGDLVLISLRALTYSVLILRAAGRRSPSALFTTIMSASSTIPFFIPWGRGGGRERGGGWSEGGGRGVGYIGRRRNRRQEKRKREGKQRE